jgi:CRP-like cAMP-binding protein
MLPDKLWYLKKMDFFEGLSDAEYAVIDRNSRSIALKKRELLSYQGTAQQSVYFVKKGKIKLLKTSPDGNSLILDILGGGTLFGELEHRTDYEDMAAEAMEDTLLCMMRRENFDHLMKLVPALSIRITKLTGFRLKKIQNRLIEMLYCSVERKLAKTLLNLAEEFGLVQQGDILINLRLTHSDLANLIASTRETVSSVLKKFRDNGLIDCRDHRFILLSKERLTRLANGEG